MRVFQSPDLCDFNPPSYIPTDVATDVPSHEGRERDNPFLDNLPNDIQSYNNS